jgi:hypothetical protein
VDCSFYCDYFIRVLFLFVYRKNSHFVEFAGMACILGKVSGKRGQHRGTETPEGGSLLLKGAAEWKFSLSALQVSSNPTCAVRIFIQSVQCLCASARINTRTSEYKQLEANKYLTFPIQIVLYFQERDSVFLRHRNTQRSDYTVS